MLRTFPKVRRFFTSPRLLSAIFVGFCLFFILSALSLWISGNLWFRCPPTCAEKRLVSSQPSLYLCTLPDSGEACLVQKHRLPEWLGRAAILGITPLLVYWGLHKKKWFSSFNLSSLFLGFWLIFFLIFAGVYKEIFQTSVMRFICTSCYPISPDSLPKEGSLLLTKDLVHSVFIFYPLYFSLGSLCYLKNKKTNRAAWWGAVSLSVFAFLLHLYLALQSIPTLVGSIAIY